MRKTTALLPATQHLWDRKKKVALPDIIDQWPDRTRVEIAEVYRFSPDRTQLTFIVGSGQNGDLDRHEFTAHHDQAGYHLGDVKVLATLFIDEGEVKEWNWTDGGAESPTLAKSIDKNEYPSIKAPVWVYK